jgi:ABC-2 type transport system ATP-binding protein
VVPQETALCDEPGAEANLTFHGDLAGVPARVLGQRIDELLELVQLADR